METAIVSIICIVLIVVGGMTLSQGFLTSADTASMALEEVGTRDKEIMRTELSTVSSEVDTSGNYVTLKLKNTGQEKLADFEKWDVIVQYFDGTGQYITLWLPYQAGTLGDNEWQVTALTMDGAAESFEPSILNPNETIEMQVKLNPGVGAGTTNMIVASTPNGIPVSVYFVH